MPRNVPVGTVTEQAYVMQNFNLSELANVQRQHDVWSKVMYYLESGDESDLPELPIPLSQFFLSREGVLCRHVPYKRNPVTQFVKPESYVVPMVLKLTHDEVLAGHPGKERTILAARRKNYWPTMRIDIDAYVARCVKCAEHKGTVPKPAPVLEYPPPERPWGVVAIDLLQLPASHQGSKYILLCVDHLSRCVI